MVLKPVTLAFFISLSIGFSQHIDRVTIERSVVTDGKRTFNLKIFGSGFGNNAGQLAISVAPTEGLTESPKPPKFSPTGGIETSFVAAESYVAKTVAVTAATGIHDSFPLPNISGAKLFRPEGSLSSLETFRLKIEGSGFAADPNGIRVILSPPPTKAATVLSVEADASGMEASFEAPPTYRPKTLGVSVNSGDIAQFSIPNDGVTSDSGDIFMYRSILDPKIASDVFGKRIGKRYIAIQAVVTNRNREFPYVIHDLTLDVTDIRDDWELLRGREKYELSSHEITILRGVAEKGRVLDGRNMTFQILQGAGVIASGLLGVTTFGPAFAPAVALFNGPFLAAFDKVFPDMTVSQMNRLSDTAFAANTIIPRQQSRIFMLFVPQALFLDKSERKRFWDDPVELFEAGHGGSKKGGSTPDPNSRSYVDLRQIELLFDGIHVQEIAPNPILTSIDIAPAERKKLQAEKPEIRGAIVGRFLEGAQIKLIGPAGLTLSQDGSTTDTRLGFILRSDKPVDPNQVLEVEVVKDKSILRISSRLDYIPDPAGLTEIKPAEGIVGTKVSVDLTGTGFMAGMTGARISTDKVTIQNLTVVSTTQIKVDFVVAADAAPGKYDVIVVNTPGGQSFSKPFEVKATPPILAKIDPAEGKVEGKISVKITGTGFLAGVTQVTISGVGLKADNIQVSSPAALTADITIDKDAVVGIRQLTVSNAGVQSTAIPFEVK